MVYDDNNPSIEYSQNEFTNRKVIERLVNQSSIARGDLVYDIGAGSGTISEVLLNRGARVVAIEKDTKRFLECKARFFNRDKFEIYLDDFLLWEFPRGQRFKVFSNIPFFHTAEIIDKLLFGAASPEDCYLIVQKEAAEKFSGIHGDTLASLLIKPLFWVTIIYYFKRTDFHPVPSVDVVLLQVEKRRCQLVPDRYYSLYRDFVVFCRERAGRSIKKSLKELFTYPQMRQVSKLLQVDYRSDPAKLNFNQYLGLFHFYLEHILKKKELILGAEAKLRRQQAQTVKIHRTRRRGKNSSPS